MLLSHKDDYEGWSIQTECREDNPDDWKVGDPVRYVAWGTASFTRPFLWRGTPPPVTKQSVEPSHFYDSNQAHNQVRDALIGKIDALKQAS